MSLDLVVWVRRRHCRMLDRGVASPGCYLMKLLSLTKRSTHSGHLIALGVAHIGGIKVRRVMKPKSRGTVARTSTCESGAVELIDRLPRARTERDHAAVADRSSFLIEWLADPKSELPGSAVLVYPPARRHPIPLRITGDTAVHSERLQDRTVKCDRLLEIIGPEVHVAEHR